MSKDNRKKHGYLIFIGCIIFLYTAFLIWLQKTSYVSGTIAKALNKRGNLKSTADYGPVIIKRETVNKGD